MAVDLVTHHAIVAVARRVLARAVERAMDMEYVDWADYPDIGENDWEKVWNEVRLLAEQADVSPEYYESAYQHLSTRADAASNEEATPDGA